MVIAFIMLSNVCKVNVYSFSFTKISYGLGTSRLTMIYFVHVHFVADIYYSGNIDTAVPAIYYIIVK